MNQSEFKATTRKRHQMGGNACNQVTLGFGLASHWLRNWRELCEPLNAVTKIQGKREIGQSIENRSIVSVKPTSEQPFARTNCYKYSFIPNTVYDWNHLPQDIINICCNMVYICKWLDFLVFSDKDDKPEVPSHNPC